MTEQERQRWYRYSLKVALGRGLSGDDAEDAAQFSTIEVWKSGKGKKDEKQNKK